MPPVRLSRRDLFERCAAVGALVTLPTLSLESVSAYWNQAEVRKPTPPNEPVPSTRACARHVLLQQTETPECHWPSKDVSSIRGGRPFPMRRSRSGTWINGGHYDLAGYRFRAKVPIDSSGGYQFTPSCRVTIRIVFASMSTTWSLLPVISPSSRSCTPDRSGL